MEAGDPQCGIGILPVMENVFSATQAGSLGHRGWKPRPQVFWGGRLKSVHQLVLLVSEAVGIVLQTSESAIAS